MRLWAWAPALLGLLLIGTASATDNTKREIRATILKTVENWSAMDADANDAYYAADDRAVFFSDVGPKQFAGFRAYKDATKKIYADLTYHSFRLNGDLAVHPAGEFAWATATWVAEVTFKNGKPGHSEGRVTWVLQKRQGKWLIVHEHYSVPAAM